MIMMVSMIDWTWLQKAVVQFAHSHPIVYVAGSLLLLVFLAVMVFFIRRTYKDVNNIDKSEKIS